MSLEACVACFDSTTATRPVLPDICFMVSPSCIIVIVICSVLTHRLCLCFVGWALTESGNCSDVWNVWYSSAHYTTESRRGTRTSIRQFSLLFSFPVRSELAVLHHAVSGKRIRRTLLPSGHSSESGVGIRSYRASDPLLFFAAVKKMAPSSREAIGQDVPNAYF